MTVPVFEPFLYRALQQVSRDEIGATSVTGALRHRTMDLPPRLVSALFMLYRDGLVTLRDTRAWDGWFSAELTAPGKWLLGEWERRVIEAQAQAG
ncbi:hypothetical protein HFP15_21340 [Amycolatopsis sp. K13G38]|uniref:MarR family transcriptional regulator n=1 Tax=Amycolatopsis acididurans TaxID=2724524 RepID=A0ABX1J6L9_9PSEU|nr:hypothetical protein [Amycolatopsis acididurans]NKQ55431.1 hypothetical protein [Amycolatopsis acididurans]